MADNRRVILFIEGNLDRTIGGSHHCLLEIVKTLDPLLFESHVLFHHEHSLIPEFKRFAIVHIFRKAPGLDLAKRLPSLGARGTTLLRPFQRAWNFLVHKTSLFLRAMRLLQAVGAEIVHINNVPTPNAWLFAALVLRIPITAHLRGFWFPNKFEQRWVKTYDSIIAISHAVLEALEHRERFPQAVVIHDGIDSDAITARAREIHDNNPIRLEFAKEPVLLIAGNITRWKGQLVACEAVLALRQSYPNILLHVVGSISNNPEDEVYAAGIRNFITVNDLETHIRFHGYAANVPACMSNADIVLHTSIEPEPLGRVILEAMSLGKSVIATARGGPKEIITDRTDGLLIVPDDPLALAEAVKLLCEDPKLRETLGANARKRVITEFALEAKVKRYTDIWLGVSRSLPPKG